MHVDRGGRESGELSPSSEEVDREGRGGPLVSQGLKWGRRLFLLPRGEKRTGCGESG